MKSVFVAIIFITGMTLILIPMLFDTTLTYVRIVHVRYNVHIQSTVDIFLDSNGKTASKLNQTTRNVLLLSQNIRSYSEDVLGFYH